MMALIARFFIVGIAYGIAFAIAVLQVLFASSLVLLGLVFTTILIPFVVLKRVLKWANNNADR